MVSEPEAAAYPPPVEVWYTTKVSGTTAGFAGYGSLVDPHIVALHQTPLALADGRGHAASLRREAAVELPRVRCRLRNGRVVIAAGVLLAPSPQYPDAAPAVFLDLAHRRSAAHIDRTQPSFPWLRGTNRNDDVGAFLRDRAQGDPEGPPPTRPRRGRHEGETERPDSPGIKPPWCWIWPACPGCR